MARGVLPAARAGVSISRWAFACAAMGLVLTSCSTERTRSAPAPSVRAEPARAARVADARGPFASVKSRPDLEQEPPTTPAALSRPTRPSDPSAELEPGANEEFDADVLLDIDAALAAVDENAFATLVKKERVLVDGELVRKEKFARPDNCRGWRSLQSRGYAPKSALAKQIDAGALVRCGALEFLARARPSRFTHVRELLVGAGPNDIPAIVASAPSPLAERARDRAVAKGSTLAEFIPAARTISSELPGRLSIAEPASSSIVILNAEVWGDINSDGIEDLALSVLNTAADGTSFDMRLVHVTRLSSSSPLSVLAVIE